MSVLMFFASFLAGAFLSPVLEPLSRQWSYFLNSALPNRELSPTELLELYFRGVIDEKTLKERLKVHGFDENKTNELISAQRKLLTLEELVVAKWRGFINEEEFITYAKKHGISEEDLKRFEAVRKFYPSPSDFIRFAVRDVFNPVIVEKYGYDEEFPEAIIEHVKKAGMESEQLKWYWRAHWELPSPTQAYEMLHRLNPEVLKIRASAYEKMGLKAEEIKTDLDTVRELLKIADYPKYWRDRLIAIAYNPLTRVDLRRIYELGLINDEELIARLMELGYTKEDAELMSNFFKRLKHEENFKIALSKIEKAYKLGKLTKDQYKELLKQAGYSDDEVEFLVSLTDYEIEEEKRERLLDLLISKYIKGLISRADFIDQAKKIGISDSEIEYWLEVANTKRESAVKTLSTSQIKQAFDRGLIDEEEALDLLISANWDSNHAKFLLEIWKAEKTKQKAK
jgi:hypothetical protein